MARESGSGLCGFLGITSGAVGNEGGVLVRDGLGLGGGAPGADGDFPAAPFGDPLTDFVAGALRPLEVPVEGRRDDPELLRSFRLREGLLRFDKCSQELGGVVREHGPGVRFMNPNRAHVKNEVPIQEPERAKIVSVKPEKPVGRASDDAVAWYLRMRLETIIDVERSKTQAQIADEADVPRSALSNIYRHSKGAGPGTAGPLAKYLGFKSRGAMVDEADRWWDTPEARDFMLDRMTPRDRDKHFPKKARRKSA